VDIKRNRHGDRAVSIVVGTERVLVKGKRRTVDVRACPVTYRPDARQIRAARQAYYEWWHALNWIRDGLFVARMLREIELSHKLPAATPWLRP
jgi:hypothetical protein